MGAVSSAAILRNRLIAALALLAVALGAVTAGPRLGVAPGMFAGDSQGERWLASGEGIQVATLERGHGGVLEKRPVVPPAPPAHPPLAAEPQLAPFAGASSALMARGAPPPHRRPDPTGPPLQG